MSNGDIEAYLANDGAPFPATPFATTTKLTSERPLKIQIGFPGAPGRATFDDVRIDRALLLPP